MESASADSRALDNQGPRASDAAFVTGPARPASVMLWRTEKSRMPPWRWRSSGT
ncbi:hypothetical protein D9M69_506330 [compost metagenome]